MASTSAYSDPPSAALPRSAAWRIRTLLPAAAASPAGPSSARRPPRNARLAAKAQPGPEEKAAVALSIHPAPP